MAAGSRPTGTNLLNRSLVSWSQVAGLLTAKPASGVAVGSFISRLSRTAISRIKPPTNPLQSSWPGTAPRLHKCVGTKVRWRRRLSSRRDAVLLVVWHLASIPWMDTWGFQWPPDSTIWAHRDGYLREYRFLEFKRSPSSDPLSLSAKTTRQLQSSAGESRASGHEQLVSCRLSQ